MIFLRIKPGQDYLIHKAIRHDFEWKNRFFFVKKDNALLFEVGIWYLNEHTNTQT